MSGNASNEVKLISDVVQNTADYPITVSSVRLDRHENVELIAAAFPSVINNILASTKYNGTMIGPATRTLAPGERAYVEVALKALSSERLGRADGLIVEGTGPGDEKFEMHTCSVLAAAPPALGCSATTKDDNAEESMVDTDYMDTICG